MTAIPMLPTHVDVFRAAARHFNVFILVRRTNLASLRYVGKPGFTPKRLDCKAKTADNDYVHPKYGKIACAGLVVDPSVTGSRVYAKPGKHASAMAEWKKFAAAMIAPQVATWEGQQKVTYIPGGRFYFVDLKPGSPHHGCVKFTSSSLLTAGKYIHGDFDLYGIVPADAPALNVAVHEMRLGQHHSRSPEFLDVQIYVNSRIGAPMVLHGAQEAYSSEHSDEGIDVFHPNGSISGAENAGAIARLYWTLFEGRKLFTKGGVRQVVRGGFVAPG